MTPPLDFVGALIVWLRPQLAVEEKIGAKVPDGPRGKFVPPSVTSADSSSGRSKTAPWSPSKLGLPPDLGP